MNDRELLEFAAKADGIEGDFKLGDGSIGVVSGYEHHERIEYWNPLTDDGDAFRLAVKLSMAVEISNRKLVWVASESISHVVEIRFNDETDPYAATRRSIVRAAAEIGKEMK